MTTVLASDSPPPLRDSAEGSKEGSQWMAYAASVADMLAVTRIHFELPAEPARSANRGRRLAADAGGYRS